MPGVTRSDAEAFAISVLTWLAADDEYLMRFLSASGAGADDLRSRAGDPDFLGFVVDYLLGDEEALVAFCKAGGHPFEAVQQARMALPGGADPHWT